MKTLTLPADAAATAATAATAAEKHNSMKRFKSMSMDMYTHTKFTIITAFAVFIYVIVKRM